MNADVEVKQYTSFEEFAEGVKLVKYSDISRIELTLM